MSEKKMQSTKTVVLVGDKPPSSEKEAIVVDEVHESEANAPSTRLLHRHQVAASGGVPAVATDVRMNGTRNERRLRMTPSLWALGLLVALAALAVIGDRIHSVYTGHFASRRRRSTNNARMRRGGYAREYDDEEEDTYDHNLYHHHPRVGKQSSGHHWEAEWRDAKKQAWSTGWNGRNSDNTDDDGTSSSLAIPDPDCAHPHTARGTLHAVARIVDALEHLSPKLNEEVGRMDKRAEAQHVDIVAMVKFSSRVAMHSHAVLNHLQAATTETSLRRTFYATAKAAAQLKVTKTGKHSSVEDDAIMRAAMETPIAVEELPKVTPPPQRTRWGERHTPPLHGEGDDNNECLISLAREASHALARGRSAVRQIESLVNARACEATVLKTLENTERLAMLMHVALHVHGGSGGDGGDDVGLDQVYLHALTENGQEGIRNNIIGALHQALVQHGGDGDGDDETGTMKQQKKKGDERVLKRLQTMDMRTLLLQHHRTIFDQKTNAVTASSRRRRRLDGEEPASAAAKQTNTADDENNNTNEDEAVSNEKSHIASLLRTLCPNYAAINAGGLQMDRGSKASHMRAKNLLRLTKDRCYDYSTFFSATKSGSDQFDDDGDDGDGGNDAADSGAYIVSTAPMADAAERSIITGAIEHAQAANWHSSRISETVDDLETEHWRSGASSLEENAEDKSWADLPCASEVLRSKRQSTQFLSTLADEISSLLPIAREMLDDVASTIAQEMMDSSSHHHGRRRRAGDYRSRDRRSRSRSRSGRGGQRGRRDGWSKRPPPPTQRREEKSSSLLQDAITQLKKDALEIAEQNRKHAPGINRDRAKDMLREAPEQTHDCPTQRAVESARSLHIGANALHTIVKSCKGRPTHDLGISSGAVQSLADAASLLERRVTLHACPRLPAFFEVEAIGLKSWWPINSFSRLQAPPFVPGMKCPWLD